MLNVPKKSLKELETLDYSSVDCLEDVNQVVGMPKVVTESKDGRLIQRVVFEATPVEKINEGLKVEDFALENLLANGYELKRIDVNTDHLENIDKSVDAIGRLAAAKVELDSHFVEQSKNE